MPRRRRALFHSIVVLAAASPMHGSSLPALAGFHAVVVFLLWVDLGVLNRPGSRASFRKALAGSVFSVLLALLFCGWVWWARGAVAGQQFLAGYLLELSLSVDNLFVFLLIFHYFGVGRELQHRVLFWGILGAVIMRASFILAGAFLLGRFAWLELVFGAFILLTGIKLLFSKDEAHDPGNSPVVRLGRRLLPMSESFEGGRFLTRRNGRLVATPLLLVLLTVEFTDVIFALDSIPAVFAITRDTFIVYTSNIFAILGLRSFYFVLERLMGKFRYIKPGVSLILILVGIKMLVKDHVHIPETVTLLVIASILGVAIVASAVLPQRGEG